MSTHETPRPQSHEAELIQRFLGWYANQTEILERDKNELLARVGSAAAGEGSDLPFLRGRVTAAEELLSSFAKVALDSSPDNTQS